MSIQKTYYTNGLLESEVFVINDLMEGHYKSYYNSQDMKPKLFCNYKDGELHGKFTQYYYDGTLEKKEYYNSDCREGECKYYNEKGQLEEVINYINDSMDGDYYKYNNGILEIKCEYYRDEYMGECLVGDYKNYYSNGQIKDICIYEDGKKNGEYKEYHPNGILKAEGNYEHNYKVGYELRYDIDGNFIGKEFVDENASADEDEYNDNKN